MATIKLRRGTAAEWAAQNPVLAQGEPGWERDTKKLKLGDGSTAWNSLPYFYTAEPDATFLERVQDAVANMLVEGTNVDFVYNDAAGTLTANVTASGGDAELMRDTIGAALVCINGVTVTPNDAGDTISISIAPSWSQLSGKPANLTALEGLVGAANKLAYFTGAGLMALSDITSWARTLLAAGSASAARTIMDVYSKSEVNSISQANSVMGVAQIKGSGNVVTTVPATTVEGSSAGRISGLAVTVIGEGRPVQVSLFLPSYRHSMAASTVGIAQGTTPIQGVTVKNPGTSAPGATVQLTVVTATLTAGVSYTFYAYGRQTTATAGSIDSSNGYPSELKVCRG
jgi:hypothetical protein